MDHKIHINSTDLHLSLLGFGTVNAGVTWKEPFTNELLEHYIDLGGNFIDTAHIYSDWVPGELARSERVVGDWLAYRGKRDDVIIATKGGHPYLDSMTTFRLSLAEMRTDIEDSLRKLRSDYIDIYFYHRDDTNRSVEELIETMETFRREGKIRYYACSNWTTKRMKEADAYCAKMGYRGFVANQALYNIATKYKGPTPDPTMVVCDSEMLEYHRTSDNLLVPYSSLCASFFHQLQKSGVAEYDPQGYNTPNNLVIGRELEQLCERTGYDLSQVMLGFFRIHDFPILPLFATSRIENMDSIMQSLHMNFCKEDYQFL